jgi:hypothetical protein
MVSNEKGGNQEMFENWVSISNEFWGSLNKMAKGDLLSQMMKNSESGKFEGFANDSMEIAMKTWKTFFSMLSNPEKLKDLNTPGENPAGEEAFKKFLGVIEKGFETLVGNFSEKADRINKKIENIDFDRFDREVFNAWAELYKEEVSRIYNLPQVGLWREYQERMAKAFDKYNLFNASLIEFMYFLYLPVEKSLKSFQKELIDKMEQGQTPEDIQACYNNWLKKLEGDYATMFHSREYTNAMGRALEGLCDFRLAKNSIVEDLLKTAPVPVQSDLDDLYREIHMMKKRIRTLEKELETGDLV